MANRNSNSSKILSSLTRPRIVAIGNPGAGKSTMLNSLAEEVLFQSGISIGSGLTERLDKKTNVNGTFYDTPGLADNQLRKDAAHAISKAMKEGGTYKLLFFVLTEAGRVLKQDVTTMKLVLEATPEVQRNYGIVINQVEKEVATLLKEEKNIEKFLTQLFYGIEPDRKCPPSNIITILERPDLKVKTNALVKANGLKDINGYNFAEFVEQDVPIVQLTKDRAGDIKAETFESTEQLLEDLQTQLIKDRQLYEMEKNELLRLLQKAEEEKSEYMASLEKAKQEQKKAEMAAKNTEAELLESQREAQAKDGQLHQAEMEKLRMLDEIKLRTDMQEKQFAVMEEARKMNMELEQKKLDTQVKERQMAYEHEEKMHKMNIDSTKKKEKGGILSTITKSKKDKKEQNQA